MAVGASQILFVDQSGQLGGAEFSLLEIAKRTQRTHAVCVFGGGPFLAQLRANGIATYALGADRFVGGVRAHAGLLRGLFALPELVHLVFRTVRLARRSELLWPNTQKAFVVAAIASIFARRPLVWHLRDILSAKHFSFANRRLVIALANRVATRVIANSQATADAFVACGGRRDLVRVIWNGIDPAPFDRVTTAAASAIREQMGLAPEAKLVGVFGRLANWKGQHIAIKAIARTRDVHLILVGDALFGEQSFRRRLRALVRRLALQDRVHLLGFRSDVPELMRACDLIVHCSTSPEPFGRVIVEGMLAGRPVIASDAGGAREIVINPAIGMLIPPADADVLAAAIERAFADPAGSAAMALAGQAYARRVFDPALFAKAIDDQAAEALAGR